MTRAAKTIEVRNPRTGACDYQFEQPGAAQLTARIQTIRRAQADWYGKGLDARCKVLLAFAEALRDGQDKVLAQLNIDTGRMQESELEISVTLEGIERWCRQMPDLLAERRRKTSVPSIDISRQLVPYAVVGCITPWNFPLLLSLIDAIPALLAGAAVVIKPSEVTPRFVEPLSALIQQVDGLKEVCCFIVGDGSVGSELIEHIDLVCFTGSVATGRKVAVAAAQNFIPAQLELGGKDPAIIMEDADIEQAAHSICWGGMANAGQSCLSIERVYVQADIADAFTAALAQQVGALRINYPDIDQGELGPIIFDKQADIIQAHLDDARARGADVVCGGEIMQHGGGNWCQPTVLKGVNHDMRIIKEETFGPVLPVISFRHEAEAITLANDTVYGLSAAVFSSDIEQAYRIARQLDAGAISINAAALTAIMHEGEKQAFKFSGLGGSRMGTASVKRFLRSKALIEREM